MSSVSVSRTVAAPIERVWTVFTSIAEASEMIPAIKEVEVLTDQPFGPGYRWRETRRMFGTDATEEMWVTAAGEQQFYEVTADSRGTQYVSRYDFVAVESGTRVDVTFTGTPHSVLAKTVDVTTGWLLSGTMRKALAKDLDDLAKVCEAGS